MPENNKAEVKDKKEQPAAKKAPKAVGSPKKTVKRKKKAKKKKSFGAVFSVILLLLIIGVGAVLYFDLFQSKQILSDLLELDKPTQIELDELDAKKVEVAGLEEDLNSSIFENNQYATELENKENELNTLQMSLEKTQQELDDRQSQMDEETYNLRVTVEMFELMDADTAAAAIDKMEDGDARIRLLTAMDSQKAAEILNYMDTDVTAEALDVILKEEVPEEDDTQE